MTIQQEVDHLPGTIIKNNNFFKGGPWTYGYYKNITTNSYAVYRLASSLMSFKGHFNHFASIQIYFGVEILSEGKVTHKLTRIFRSGIF